MMNSIIIEGIATGEDFCFVSNSCPIADDCGDCPDNTEACEPVEVYFTVECEQTEAQKLLKANYKEGRKARVVGKVVGVVKLTYNRDNIIVKSEHIEFAKENNQWRS